MASIGTISNNRILKETLDSMLERGLKDQIRELLEPTVEAVAKSVIEEMQSNVNSYYNNEFMREQIEIALTFNGKKVK